MLSRRMFSSSSVVRQAARPASPSATAVAALHTASSSSRATPRVIPLSHFARPSSPSLPWFTSRGSQLQRQQRRLLSTETKQAIERAVESAPVVLFMKGTPETPQCGFSRASIQILGLQGVDPDKFAAFNVLEDPDLRAGIKEYSDWPTIPQLYVNKEFIGGCDILVSMHQSGELAKLLEEKKVLIPAESAAEKDGKSGEGASEKH